MAYGLKDSTISKIQNCLKSNSKIEKAILYGSRAKRNYRIGSDIDLVLKGDTLNYDDLVLLDIEIDDLLLPYKFDISIHHQITNQNLLAHIERVGKVFYEQEAN